MSSLIHLRVEAARAGANPAVICVCLQVGRSTPITRSCRVTPFCYPTRSPPT